MWQDYVEPAVATYLISESYRCEIEWIMSVSTACRHQLIFEYSKQLATGNWLRPYDCSLGPGPPGGSLEELYFLLNKYSIRRETGWRKHISINKQTKWYEIQQTQLWTDHSSANYSNRLHAQQVVSVLMKRSVLVTVNKVGKVVSKKSRHSLCYSFWIASSRNIGTMIVKLNEYQTGLTVYHFQIMRASF